MLPVLGVLRVVPIWAWALGAAVAWGGYHRVDSMRAKAAFQTAQVQAQAEHAAQLAKDTAETQRRTRTIMEAADAATIRSQEDRAAADAARTAADRLRQRLAKANTGASDPATAASCATAIASADLHAQVLDRVIGAARQLSEYADSAVTAGRACERSYDALKGTP